MNQREAQLRRPRGIRLADLETARGSFSGRTIPYRSPCSASDFATCHVAREMAVWNEFLVCVHVELRMLPEATGHLGLFVIERGCPRIYNPYRTHQGATLLYWLLTTHRCVTSLEAHHDTLRFYPDIFAAILKSNAGLKTLKIHIVQTGFLETLFSTIPNLKQLKELHCTSSETCPEKLLYIISRLLRTTTSLTSLSTTVVSTGSQRAEMMFFTALKANSTLKALTLCYEGRYGPHKRAFEEYLKSTLSLRTLQIVAASKHESEAWLASIFRGLVANTSLKSVTLNYFCIDHTCFEVLAEVFIENKTLSTLHLGLLTPTTPRPQSTVTKMCVDAIIENKSLELLSLPLDIWEPTLWYFVFESLSPKMTLKINSFSSLLKNPLTDSVRQLLRASCGPQNILLGACYFDRAISPEIYKAFSKIYLPDRTSGGLNGVILQEMPSFNRLKTLNITASPENVVYALALARYIEATCTLRALNVLVPSHWHYEDVFGIWWHSILQALSHNSSIVELEILITDMKVENLKKLANFVKGNQQIRILTLCLEAHEKSSVFLRHLSEGISENYALTRVVLRTGIQPTQEWSSIMDTARRNGDLVIRALVSTTASNFDKWCASALEPVAQHPALLQEFAELAAVSETEAAGMIRSVLRSLQDIDNFMQAVGVVRKKLVCNPRDGGSMQLDELNMDCWLHVRKYLNFDDVLYPASFP